MTNPTNKSGMLITIPEDQGGAQPRLVTNSDPLPVTNYLIEVAKGNIEGHRIIHKFGSGVIGTTPLPIASSGIFMTPSAPVSLEFISDNSDDATGGIGATKIIVQGLDANWVEISQEIATNGTTAVQIPIDMVRLHRWYVSESGSYADNIGASYVGELTIRESGGGDTWDIISDTSPFPAQSEIGAATIPLGFTGYVLSKNIFTDTSKIATIYMMQRPLANDVTTPYSGTRRLIERDVGVSGGYNVNYVIPKGPFIGPCDIGFMGEVSVGTADVSVEFEILVVEDGY